MGRFRQELEVPNRDKIQSVTSPCGLACGEGQGLRALWIYIVGGEGYSRLDVGGDVKVPRDVVEPWWS